jgi:hypothetical protein
MWIFESGTGRWLLDGPAGLELVATGYSGISVHKNVPTSQNLAGLGPVPLGQYAIGEASFSEKSGPLTMHLIPQSGTNTYGRSGFEIHGDSKDHPGGASHGCIILPREIRVRVADSRDRLLSVVSGLQRPIKEPGVA